MEAVAVEQLAPASLIEDDRVAMSQFCQPTPDLSFQRSNLAERLPVIPHVLLSNLSISWVTFRCRFANEDDLASLVHVS